MLSKNSVVGIIGSGAMGAGIAQVAASAGHTVFVYDNNNAQLEKAKNNLAATLSKLVEKQKITEADAKTVQQRISWTGNLADFKNCGLVIEAVIENLEVKQRIFTDLEKIVSADCVLASNTSSL
ncbi:MAG: 3-hydroxybutyryl-CoA dehydrogenase, partial [Bacteroidetes bacterium]